ncbi:MAG: hypothetical protein ACFE9L_03845 [Candidatus Hodarchaeota archaeon]
MDVDFTNRTQHIFNTELSSSTITRFKNSIKISNYFKTKLSIAITSSGVQYHLDKLQLEEQVTYRIISFRNRTAKVYFPSSPTYKFYIEGIDKLGWKENQKVFFYARKPTAFSVTPKEIYNMEISSIRSFPLRILKDDKGYYLLLPENVGDFYDLENIESFDQAILSQPFPFLSVVIYNPNDTE